MLREGERTVSAVDSVGRRELIGCLGCDQPRLHKGVLHRGGGAGSCPRAGVRWRSFASDCAAARTEAAGRKAREGTWEESGRPNCIGRSKGRGSSQEDPGRSKLPRPGFHVERCTICSASECGEPAFSICPVLLAEKTSRSSAGRGGRGVDSGTGAEGPSDSGRSCPGHRHPEWQPGWCRRSRMARLSTGCQMAPDGESQMPSGRATADAVRAQSRPAWSGLAESERLGRDARGLP